VAEALAGAERAARAIRDPDRQAPVLVAMAEGPAASVEARQGATEENGPEQTSRLLALVLATPRWTDGLKLLAKTDAKALLAASKAVLASMVLRE
jgi:hypothetical protein